MTRNNRAIIFKKTFLRFEREPKDSVNINNSNAMWAIIPLARYKKFISKLDPIAVSANVQKKTTKRIVHARINASIYNT